MAPRRFWTITSEQVGNKEGKRIHKFSQWLPIFVGWKAQDFALKRDRQQNRFTR
jgi:hypothetical protein